MWLREEHYKEPGIRQTSLSLAWAFMEGVKLQHLVNRFDLKPEDIWHQTRIVEYPMMLKHLPVPKRGAILDVGSNDQFPLALMKCWQVTAKDHDFWLHHTSHDVGGLGMTFPPVAGIVPTELGFRDTNGIWKMIFGDPGCTDLLNDHFDVIWNVSVMEHVEPENLRRWMDGLWRWLKPGGRMMLSCDWWVGKGLNEGRVNFLYNHDFRFVLDELGGKLFAGKPAEIPWHEKYDPSTEAEAWSGPCEEAMLTVYFWGVEKPL